MGVEITLMKLPFILTVDDDDQVLRAIERDLRKEYRKSYRILSTTSAIEALETLKDLKSKAEDVALFLSDQRMPEMLGVEFLEKAKTFYPEAKRVLLTAYSDTDASIKAINDVQLDYYLLKPWNPPEEKLYPVITDQLGFWEMTHIPEFQGIKVIGYQYSSKSHVVKDFLAGNLIPYQWLDMQKDPKSEEMVNLFDLAPKDLPTVFFPDGSYLKDPSLNEIGNKIGLKSRATEKLYDVVIVGAGPAGLAAAVYGGSEGLRTLLIEKRAPGGQAGTSSRIENYLGFPKGLSGAELSHRAISQATRFGVELLNPQTANKIEINGNYKTLHLEDGSKINTRAIVITTGVDYRKLDNGGLGAFTGAGVYYGAAMTEAQACKDRDVYIIGGGNSAGQAAMYLSTFAKKVFIIIRKPDLSGSMSYYLIDQINHTSNIEVLPNRQLIKAYGEEYLEGIILRHSQTGEEEDRYTNVLFVFIGAKPHTEWIGAVIKNERGFIETGPNMKKYELYKRKWKLIREPFLLESSEPGIFAAGDVRATAMNRVASAVGEGAMAIKFVHEYLAET